jgi:hypothetical protein
MFGDLSAKEIAVWLAGFLVAAVIVILSVNYILKHYIIPPKPRDPLTKQGGLNPVQKLK